MWPSILSNSWRVGQDFSASCNNSLSSVERVSSSTPVSNGLKRLRLPLGLKMSTGRPSLRPIPHILIVPSCGEFYKAVLLFRARKRTANPQPRLGSRDLRSAWRGRFAQWPTPVGKTVKQRRRPATLRLYQASAKCRIGARPPPLGAPARAIAPCTRP